MSRPLAVALVAAGVLVFLAAAALLTRVLVAASDERSAAIEVVRAQVRGDEARVLDLIDGCRRRPSCRATVRANVARLRRRGRFEVLNVRSPGFSLGARTGRTRVAWRTGDGLPVVQCVTVRRAGNPIEGFRLRVLALSPPIARDASC